MLMQLFPNCTQIHVLPIYSWLHPYPRKVPHVIVTDNGSPFTSEEFKMHVYTQEWNQAYDFHPAPPLHQRSSWEDMQTLKRGLKCTPSNSVQEKLSRFLFGYRITPHTTNWCFSMWDVDELQVKVSFRFLPEISRKVESRQAKQKLGATWPGHWDSSLKVYVQGFTTRKPKLISGTVVEVTGSLSYMIKLEDGATVRRQKEQLRVTPRIVLVRK